jgi:hypothetical protein
MNQLQLRCPESSGQITPAEGPLDMSGSRLIQTYPGINISCCFFGANFILRNLLRQRKDLTTCSSKRH